MRIVVSSEWSVSRGCIQNKSHRTDSRYLFIGSQFLNKESMNRENAHLGAAPGGLNVTCSACGALIRTNAEANAEQICLICHARMLNDYFQRVRKVDGGDRLKSRHRP